MVQIARYRDAYPRAYIIRWIVAIVAGTMGIGSGLFGWLFSAGHPSYDANISYLAGSVFLTFAVMAVTQFDRVGPLLISAAGVGVGLVLINLMPIVPPILSFLFGGATTVVVAIRGAGTRFIWQ